MGIFLFCPEDLPQSMRLVEDELLSKARERWGASYLGGRWGQHFGYQRWSWVFALLIISFLWVPTKKMDLCPCKYYCIMRLHLCNRWMYELPDAIKIWLELRSRSCFLFFSSQFRKWKRHNILPIRKGVSQHKDFMKSIQKLWEFLFFPFPGLMMLGDLYEHSVGRAEKFQDLMIQMYGWMEISVWRLWFGDAVKKGQGVGL